MDNYHNDYIKSVSDISDGYTQMLRKSYYNGRGAEHTFFLQSNAVSMLYNPKDSGVNLIINRITITNLSGNPVVANSYAYSSAYGNLRISNRIANTNTTNGINRAGMGQIYSGKDVEIRGGINNFVNSLTPFQTFVIPINSSALIAPGQSRIIELLSLEGEGRGVAQFSWWEEPLCD